MGAIWDQISAICGKPVKTQHCDTTVELPCLPVVDAPMFANQAADALDPAAVMKRVGDALDTLRAHSSDASALVSFEKCVGAEKHARLLCETTFDKNTLANMVSAAEADSNCMLYHVCGFNWVRVAPDDDRVWQPCVLAPGTRTLVTKVGDTKKYLAIYEGMPGSIHDTVMDAMGSLSGSIAQLVEKRRLDKYKILEMSETPYGQRLTLGNLKTAYGELYAQDVSS